MVGEKIVMFEKKLSCSRDMKRGRTQAAIRVNGYILNPNTIPAASYSLLSDI
jgi:hypothetical protein